MADSCPPESFKDFLEKHPNHKVVTYVNTPASIKALSDITCTSINAEKVIKSIPLNEKIIFAPDKNPGNYLSAKTGREMILWDGACHVHEQFSLRKILEYKEQNPEAKLIAHPEYEEPVRIAADFVGSTSALLNFVKKDDSKQYIVATDSWIIHQMQKHKPEKQFVPAPGMDSTCGCSDCEFMKLNTLQKIHRCLKSETPEISLSQELTAKARLPIERMLELS